MRCRLGWVMVAVGASGGALAAPLNVTQSSPNNSLSLIQQHNTVISIDRNITASDGRRTITEITQIGPDPAPARVRQSGASNLVRSVQQGRDPILDLRQDGSVNRAVSVQTFIP